MVDILGTVAIIIAITGAIVILFAGRKWRKFTKFISSDTFINAVTQANRTGQPVKIRTKTGRVVTVKPSPANKP